VSTSVLEMSSDAAAKLWDNTINREIFDLIHSPNTNDKLGGLLAIGVLHPTALTDC
jgi:FKBP12-rapamycin complex-associated protein